MPILEVKNLSLAYKNNQAQVSHGPIAPEENKTIIFSDLSFSIEAGEQISLVGRSGNGKSSLLYLLAGFEQVAPQTIFWQGQDLAQMSAKQINQLRNKSIGFIFQFHNLLPDFTALENVLLPAQIGNFPLAPAKERAYQLLEYMGLKERINHYPEQLSGGERQRVAIARALINNPQLILADEPTGNLDQETASEVMKLISQISRDFATSILLVTHDPEIAQSMPQRWQLDNGRIKAYAN
ncbi:hypothetical protein CJP74_01940 [Psittacicella melopsittaci]|uniref:ABC transporter domain-containing protein n=1 Tax=Psittacicella melopsittaci TaxID=2028576 RepID=A0A3A1Y780_9GAMM|nr:ABC transporter ATP-binding protein [Psittacicella melopsittaci]RIY33371.1 hypothetical protein CJP74_01940 [Psittacicella melopsittaci]